MHSTLVALDLETTGLNAERDAIIEVAAVRFSDGQVLDEYQSLVQSEAAIPQRVRQITGLTPEDLEGAPDLDTVLPQLVRFVGPDPVVGHSVDHDLAFIRRHGELLNQRYLDTFELAGILVPEATRYGLGQLLDLLGIEQPSQLHRALADAHAHRLLYEALLERSRNLDPELLSTINRLARAVDWPLADVFRHAAKSPVAREEDTEQDGWDVPPPLQETADPQTLDGAALENLIAPGGRLQRDFAGFEDRPGQQQMLRLVAEAFIYGGQLLVEAGTGIGKTLAYLVPAAAWSTANGRPVIVATHTRNLQDQLLSSDLPMVGRLLDEEVRGSVLKGRANYLCRTRLQAAIDQESPPLEDVRTLVKILVWQTVTRTGDRAELLLQRSENPTWRRVSAEGSLCTADSCRHARQGNCWLHRARARACASNLVVVNHALLVSDMLADNRLLPRHAHLIVDEAHHLEEVATRSLGVQTSLSGVRETVTALSGRSGLLVRAAKIVATAELPDDARAKADQALTELRERLELVSSAATVLFEAVEAFLAEHTDGRSQDVRLTDATRAQPDWLAVEREWDGLQIGLGESRSALGRLIKNLRKNLEEHAEVEQLAGELSSSQRELVGIEDAFARVISRPAGGDVLWASRAGNQVTLHAAPLHVGDLLADALFSEKEMLVLTSATLRAGESFSFIRDRLALPDADEVAIPSPFDYGASTRLFIPSDMPNPNEAGYQAALDEIIIALARAVEGRMLVLYTSYSGLKRSYRRISDPLGQSGISVLGQGIDGGRQKLLDQFRSSDVPTVLLGTRSFWEGIDVPGPGLSSLVIARLPFDVPTDPVFQARSETFDEPFFEYSVPLAVLRFRQGFGRLIRTAQDRGVAVILDSRVRTKSYGQLFLEALPAMRLYDGPMHALPERAKRFLAGEPVESLGSDSPATSLDESEPLYS